jgi:hypothetical protein
MRKFFLWAALALLIISTVVGVGWWAYWNYFERYKPITVEKEQAAIQKLLDSAGYVSSGTEGPPLYVVTFRDCKECSTYEDQEFPKFAAIGVDRRVIAFAPADVEGLQKSTPAERSTIAELWLNRNWSLYEAWRTTPVKAWAAPGIRPADGDLARSAVVQASRDFKDQLEPLLRANGVEVRYPIVMWRDKDNKLKVCACSDEKMYHFVREDLGAPEKAPAGTMLETVAPAPTASAAVEPAPATITPEAYSASAAPQATGDYGPGAPEVTTVQ